MELEILAPIALLCAGLVALVYTQVIAPRRNHRAVAAALGGQGWLPVDPGEAPGWSAVVALAVERAAGSRRDADYDEKTGPFTSHVRRREQRTGRTLELYRDAGATHARYAAVGVHQERTSTDTRTRHDRHNYVGREIWIGEARALPVDAPKVVFRSVAELARPVAVPMAVARDRRPDDIPGLTPPDDRLAESVRAVLAETDLARSAMADVYVAPGAWVLTAPLVKAGSRIEEILALARAISAVLDRWTPGR